jgi:hypothetical protein
MYRLHTLGSSNGCHPGQGISNIAPPDNSSSSPGS